ncbi:hypothetical protein CON65_09445 [Bacillus pseudomycoides]|uniref:Uncharacterized protein n=1 Tax=Bacillus pseudomycoides TaxID=64104 RepID=A0AA91ZTR1_9BACI|nr:MULTISPECIES: hypothetical protein [Bacillus]PEB48006.1 hypothetical protein COO03_24775 [Bacillus sp. AFS098217]PED82884.1 hypothetical protein CON65_09445 [Bacillus pseudomycoides]PEU09721.1 hypothetical protein CN524_17970 [Bacillus sp. AFS019443]PEU18416.1 hypothetical protein CN525_11770 [Bacillus sp. AFS014408]PFW62660.1 hypothetical protein COL20_12120 [Bacillus sp. AFS075034]
MATNKKAFTLRLQEDNFKKIQFISENEHRSIANKIEVLIIEEIKKYEQEKGEIVIENEESAE